MTSESAKAIKYKPRIKRISAIVYKWACCQHWVGPTASVDLVANRTTLSLLGIEPWLSRNSNYYTD